MGTLLLLLAACTGVRLGGPDVVKSPVLVSGPAESVGLLLPSLISRIDSLLATVDEIDRRDRLVELRDLASAAWTLDPAARRRVASYVERVVGIEERSRPVPLAESPIELAESEPITNEEPLGVGPIPPTGLPAPEPTPPAPEPAPPAPEPAPPAPDPAPIAVPGPESAGVEPAPADAIPAAVSTVVAVVPASPGIGPPVEPPVATPGLLAADPLVPLRAMLVRRDYLAVVTAVDGSPELAARADALVLRREGIDGWSSDEREAAAASFLAARSLQGDERSTALRGVVEKLTAINVRFPENIYAVDIQKHVELVAAELSR